jgi:hypothetical protein
MRRYFFNLKTNRGVIRDLEGTELPDGTSAREHAHVVAREIMRNRDLSTKAWLVDVSDGHGNSDFEVLFASANPSISALPAEMRAPIEEACRKAASLSDAINQIHTTVHQVRATIARSERKLHLAALDGALL